MHVELFYFEDNTNPLIIFFAISKFNIEFYSIT